MELMLSHRLSIASYNLYIHSRIGEHLFGLEMSEAVAEYIYGKKVSLLSIHPTTFAEDTNYSRPNLLARQIFPRGYRQSSPLQFLLFSIR